MTLEVARQRAEQWRETFSQRKTRHGDLEIAVTMSVGLASYPDHGATAEVLLESADQALYKAKAAGRNRVEIAGTA
jgi:diguanylate cyclase (GGDEF)-like protein